MKSLITALVLLLVSVSSHADWEYSSDEDAMTSKKTTNARIRSTNSLALGFPYAGANYGKLTVRQHPKHGLNVIFILDKGQLMCPVYDGCKVTVRFDEKPAMVFEGVPPTDSSSNVVFINNESRFIAAARTAKKILVQVTIYKAGSQVLQFETAQPLEWGASKQGKAKSQ